MQPSKNIKECPESQFNLLEPEDPSFTRTINPQPEGRPTTHTIIPPQRHAFTPAFNQRRLNWNA